MPALLSPTTRRRFRPLDNELTAASVVRFRVRAQTLQLPSLQPAPDGRTDGQTDGRRFLPHQSRRRLHLHHEMRRSTGATGAAFSAACQPQPPSNPTTRRDGRTLYAVRPSHRSIFERCILISASRSVGRSVVLAWPSSSGFTFAYRVHSGSCFLNRNATYFSDKS